MMICKTWGNLKFVFKATYSVRHKFSSALYITGDKAHKTFALLNPVIDFEKQFGNKDTLEKNFKARQLPLDINKLEERWKFFDDVRGQKNTLEATRAKIGSWIKELMKDAEKNKDEIAKYKLHLKLVKDDLSSLKPHFYGLEENTMLMLLNLPNALHEKTPREPVIIHEFLEKPEGTSPSHVEIAEMKNLIDYIDPLSCYFKSEAALFEMAILSYFKHSLLDLNYTIFSNPHFCRSVIVEGCGISHEEKDKVFILEQRSDSNDDTNLLHLCGGATLYPFMAYFCRHYVQPTYFPFKLFSIGKKYQPVDDKAPKDLFNMGQEAAISVFTATVEEEDLLEDLIKHVTAVYEPLGYHFRLVYLPAEKLDKAESLRLSIQMYSNHLREYIEVGNISCYDSYLSKRLLFTYTVNKERKYPKVIAGTLLNVPKVFACILENHFGKDTALITPLLQKFMFL